MPDGTDRIDHVIVLMLENRSFDHMLGWPAVAGRQIPVDPANPAAGLAPVFVWNTPDAYRTTPDPGHEFEDVTLQLFGGSEPPATATPTNDGFVLSYSQRRDDDGHQVGPEVGKKILGCFGPSLLPVMRTLAEHFVVCDHWFASVPGPTWPNRDYVHAGTSMGRVNSPTAWELLWGYPRVRTIYQNLQDAGKTWKIYYHDVSQAFYFRDLVEYQRTNFVSFAEFEATVRQGTLPQYSFIEPRFFSTLLEGANDQHPPHDVREGERLIATIYDALRSQEDVWRQSLFVVVYDEHGGFYDRVPPPADAVNPDGINSIAPPFAFDRFGVRVPALLVSPWVPKGQIDSTTYDHTSVLSFLKKHFGLPRFLHRRDEAAPTFEHNFLDSPRTDTPTNLTAVVPLPSEVTRTSALAEHAQRPPSEYQRGLMTLAASLQHPRTQHRAAMFVADQVAKLTGVTPARAKGPADRGPKPSGKRSRKGRGATSRPHRA